MMASALTSAACAPAATVTVSARAPTVCSRYPDSLVLIMIGSLPLAPVYPDHIVFYATFELCPQGCHPRESGGPGQATEWLPWIPAFAGMTMEGGSASVLQSVNPPNCRAPCGRPPACAPAPGAAARSSPAYS